MASPKTLHNAVASPHSRLHFQVKCNTKTMKTKTSKQPKQSKRSVQLKDIRPKKDAKGGTLHTGGINVALGDGSVRDGSSNTILEGHK